MNNPLAVIRNSVLDISPYYMSEKVYQVKLNQNESPYDLPRELKAEIWQKFEQTAWNRYPSFTTETLRRKIAEKIGVSTDMVLLGNGSNELIQLICSIILEPGKKFMIVQPTFQLYEQIGRIFGADLMQLELSDNFQYPVPKILSELETNPIPLQIYCSPNNPTGSILTLEQIESILQASSGIVVIDEAYYDFSKITATGLIAKYPNLVITRTFSKACGLAGLRVGYLIGSPEVVAQVYKAKLPYNLDTLSEIAALTILENEGWIERRVKSILEQRDWLMTQLRRLKNIQIYPTHANFFLISTPFKPDYLFETLLGEGILVRNVSRNHPKLANVIRVSIGTSLENQRLVQVFQEIWNSIK